MRGGIAASRPSAGALADLTDDDRRRVADALPALARLAEALEVAGVIR